MKISSLPHGCVGNEREAPLSVLQWFDTAARRDLDGVEVMDHWVMQGLMTSVNRPLMTDIQNALSASPLDVSAFINHGPHVWPAPEKNILEVDSLLKQKRGLGLYVNNYADDH